MEHANSNDNAKRKAEHIRKAQIMKAALMDTRLNGTDYRVLAILAETANSLTGECYPSHETIAEQCGLTVAGARKATYRLRAAGYLQWETVMRDKGRGTINFYEFHLPNHRYTRTAGDPDHCDESSTGRANSSPDHCYQNDPTTATGVPATTATTVAPNLSESEPIRDNLSDARSLRSRAAREEKLDDILWEKIGGDLTKEQRANANVIHQTDPAYGKILKQEAIKAERRQRGEGAKRLLHLAQHWQQPPPAGETEDDSPLRH